MERIKNQIKSEKAKSLPDKHLIDRLERILEKGSISFDQFCGGASFVPREEYENSDDYNINEPLHNDCTDVIKYYGGYHIQAINGGGFMTYVNGNEHPITSASLDIIEDMLWSIEAEKILNKSIVN